MILMCDELTDAMIEERCEVVRRAADSHKEIMYLENHGNKDKNLNLEVILPYMTDYFN